MKKLLCCACAALLLIAAASPCFAKDSPWNGTWKENQAKSKMSGDTVIFTAKGGGVFHYSNGGTIEYDFACDGKSYTTLGDRSVSCTGTAETGMDTTSMAHGAVLSKYHRSISADGRTMTIHGTAMHPDGTTEDFDETYKRVTGSKGLAGKWLDVKVKEQGESTMVVTVADKMLHIEVPSQKEVMDGKLDGSDGKVNGPNIPPGAAPAYKSVTPNKISYEIKLNGKVLYDGTYTLSADGKTLTEEEWVPGRMAEKESVVYDKR
jgi:hypothetical protein